jgi:hypothetical protein
MSGLQLELGPGIEASSNQARMKKFFASPPIPIPLLPDAPLAT